MAQPIAASALELEHRITLSIEEVASLLGLGRTAAKQTVLVVKILARNRFDAKRSEASLKPLHILGLRRLLLSIQV